MHPFVRGTPPAVLVVDDHALVRRAVQALLGAHFPDAQVIGAGSGHEAVAVLDARPALRVDLILVDLELPDCNGLDLLPQLRALAPQVPMAILSGQDSPALRRRAREAGAQGYLSKTMPPARLVVAIGQLLAGPGVGEDGWQDFLPQGTYSANAKRPALTAQQARVLGALCDGLSNQEIARHLGLAVGTVKMHLTSLYSALGVSSRAQAILAARTLGGG